MACGHDAGQKRQFRQHMAGRGRRAAGFSVAAVALVASPLLASLGSSSLQMGGGRSSIAPPAGSAALIGLAAVPPASSDAEGVHFALQEALAKVRPMEAEVSQGKLVRSFGKKAEDIVTTASARAGKAAKEVEVVLDGLLRSLFLRQLALLRHRALELPADRRRPATALEKADELFASSASDLVRPGSDWSFEADREALKTDLYALLNRDAELLKQRRQMEAMRRSGMDVVGKARHQLERLGEALYGLGGGSPWMLWTTHRLPGTQYMVTGSYQPGRANIEFSPVQTADPVTAEAGFVEGLTSKNLGLSFNFRV
eukprot:TRINITY_DN17479_c0_g1_i1.p1 TRINITY_DN17479_c0_g1~~TRINITY_DN17479_c0_g1_i1.p1  ORF type:complete len:314 (-),score=82.11 TRINITY_DN17479_c0_g1_i1:55-996(-)